MTREPVMTTDSLTSWALAMLVMASTLAVQSKVVPILVPKFMFSPLEFVCLFRLFWHFACNKFQTDGCRSFPPEIWNWPFPSGHKNVSPAPLPSLRCSWHLVAGFALFVSLWFHTINRCCIVFVPAFARRGRNDGRGE